MKRERIIFFIGLWVILLPFLGFPNSWRKILFVATGLLIVFFSYVLRKEKKEKAMQSGKEEENNKMNTFVDNIGSTQ